MPKKKGEASVIVRVVDKATSYIRRINRALRTLTSPFRAVSNGVKWLGRATGVTALGANLVALGNKARIAAGHVASIITPLGALTGAATLAGIGRMVSQFGEFGNTLSQVSARTGVGVTSLQNLRGAAELAGASARDMDAGLHALTDNLQNAANGRNNELLNTMNRLGISFRDARGEVLPLTQLLPRIADRLARIERPSVRARVASQLFGGAAEALLPLLSRGGDGIRRLTEEADRNGRVTRGQVDAAERFRVAQVSLSQAIDGTMRSISEALVPAIVPLMASMRNWLNVNRQWIATGIADAVRSVATWITSVDWVAVGRGFTSVATGIADAFRVASTWIKSVDWTAIGRGIASVGRGIRDLVSAVDGFLGGDGSGVRAIGAFIALWATATVVTVAARIGTVAAAVKLLATAGSALMGSGLLTAMGGFIGSITPFLGPLALVAAGIAAVASLQPVRPHEEGDPRRGTTGGSNTGRRADGYYRSGDNRVTDEESWLMDQLTRDGYTVEQAAGVAANFRHEGGRWDAVNPEGGGNGARGGFQWRGPRQEAFTRWHRTAYPNQPVPAEINEASREVQYGFLRHELGGTNRPADQDLRQARSPFDAGVSFGQNFERYGRRDTAAGRAAAEREDAARGDTAEGIARAYRARQAGTGQRVDPPEAAPSAANGNTPQTPAGGNTPPSNGSTPTRAAGSASPPATPPARVTVPANAPLNPNPGQQQSSRGTVDVNITVAGLPAGATVETRQTGEIVGAVRPRTEPAFRFG